MFREGFNQPLSWPTNQVIDPAVWVESWSGYALNRQLGTVVNPWVVSMVASNGAYRVDPERGALRWWYSPAGWSSASTGLGSGPGNPLTLLALVSTNSGTSAVWWSLVISENGNEIHLICQTENGPAACLSAPIAFQAGSWHCLAIGHTSTNSTMFVDGQQVAVGSGLLPVPAELAPSTSLVLGSSLSGQSSAGQLEEFASFTARRRLQEVSGQCFGLNIDWEIGTYYSNKVKVAALGPITPAEEAAWLEKRLAAQQTMDSGPAEGPLEGFSGPCGTNAVNDVWPANIAAWPNGEGGWNTSLSIAGGTNGVWYDVFGADSLSGASLTNLPWMWAGRGHACDTIVLTNQPEAASFYVLAGPQDSDFDGITDAYCLLVLKTPPPLGYIPSSDGYGTPDAWYLRHGLNPLAPGVATADANGDGVPNWQEYLWGTDPLSTAAGFGIWVGSPSGFSAIP